MDEKLLAIKAGMAAICTAASALLGWRGILALIWVVAMLLDYISGTAAACKSGAWSSATARQGLWHKGGMIIVVLVAAIADLMIATVGDHLPLGGSWPNLILPLVLAWYIFTEAGSILENAVKLGAPVPAWLVKLLKISIKTIDTAAEEFHK